MAEFQNFVNNHQDQLVACEVPKHYWRTLFEKLKFQIFDADESFNVVKNVEAPTGKTGLRSTRTTLVKGGGQGIEADDGEKIFVIDHAWTFSLVDARDQLTRVPGLLDRVAAIVGVEGCTGLERREPVMEEIWKYCQYCGITDPETGKTIPLWYLWDEFGSSVGHGEANVRIRPFYYVDREVSYSLMWPTRDLRCGEHVYHDYVGPQSSADVRRARAVPWTREELTDIADVYTNVVDSHFSAGETLPIVCDDVTPLPVADKPVKVFTDLALVRQFLTDKRYHVVENMEEADVVWLSSHIKDFRKFTEENQNRFVNQFPGEYVLTVKDMLALTCRGARDEGAWGPNGDGDAPKTNGDGDAPETNGDGGAPGTAWLPVTYLLQQELPQFVAHYQKRRKSGKNNVWICKPWNECRGADTHITDNLDYLIRLAETQPKVVCKYIHDPVLYSRPEVGQVKFDVRYVLYLTSVRPLVLHANKVFWLRFANRPYALDDFHDYQKHFTVMNYVDGGTNLKQVHSDEFVKEFDKQYPQFPWEGVERSILSMFRSMFECGSREEFPRGIHQYPQARAVYAADLMLSWVRDEEGFPVAIQPQICELNFSPDNVRACQYHPDFYNQAFNLLFHGEDDGGFHVL